MELQEQDSKAFEEIVSILQCHPEIEKFELAKEADTIPPRSGDLSEQAEGFS